MRRKIEPELQAAPPAAPALESPSTEGPCPASYADQLRWSEMLRVLRAEAIPVGAQHMGVVSLLVASLRVRLGFRARELIARGTEPRAALLEAERLEFSVLDVIQRAAREGARSDLDRTHVPVDAQPIPHALTPDEEYEEAVRRG